MGKSLIFRTGVLYFILLVSNITIMIVMVFENQVDLIAQNALLNSRLIGLQFHEAFREEDVQRLDEDLMRSFNVTSFRVYTGDGQAISEQYGEPLDYDEDQRTTAIHTALTRRDFENRLFHHTLDYSNRTLELFVPIESSGLRERVIVAAIEMSSIDRQIGYLYRQSLILGFMVLILHLLYAWYLGHSILRPLNQILRGTEEVARGNLDVRIAIPDQNELGRMARAFNEMSTAVVRMRNEARASNPLTELPGNPAIFATLDTRKEEAIAVLYIDLDNFKTFNDRYGFARGDDAILFTRDILLDGAARFEDTFVGHQGGDDFVIVTTLSAGIPLAEEIVRLFETKKAHLIDANDLKQGYILGIDRSGKEQKFPLLSVSIAIVTNETRTFAHPGDVAGIAAEIKHLAKGTPGSSWAIDKRSERSEVNDTATSPAGDTL